MQGSVPTAYTLSYPPPPPPEAQLSAERRRCSAMLRVRQAQLSMMGNGGLCMPNSNDYSMPCHASERSVDELIDKARPLLIENAPAAAHSSNKSTLIDDDALSDVSIEELLCDTSQSARKTHAPSPSHKPAVPGLPAIMKPPVAATCSASSVSRSHSFPNSVRPDAPALPSLAGAVLSEDEKDHNDSMSGRTPRADVVSRRGAGGKPVPDAAAWTNSKSRNCHVSSLPASRSISSEHVSLDVPEKKSNTKSRRMTSKEPSSFKAFRSRMRTQTLETVERKENEDTTDDISEAHIARKYGVDSFDVQRLLKQFYAALAADVNARGGCLSLPSVQSLICTMCHLPADESLPVHLVDADWHAPSEDYRLGPEGFIAWWKNHQWCEEIMVPDPDERKVRQFCRDQDYDLPEVERVKAAFDKADQNGSGKLDPAEFRAAVASLQNPDESAINDATFLKLWKEVDADSSGTIELLEFAKWYLQNT
eukprot:TRINITY_DN24065_c0_g1_i1.p1 TRINITY_DN24065_c0_g1~~TRINITY_DN24065_c0_g1_i1.p1  ORF type:complete len:479 (+),score=80.41 TRINITY_DN24065_c0_g1_i1:110-1546(+)